MSKSIRLVVCAVLGALVAVACTSDDIPDVMPTTSTRSITSTSTPPGSTTTTARPIDVNVPVPVHIDENGFDDHTVPAIASVDEYFALARQDDERAVVKFSIADMLGDPAVRWSDSNFYSLHDEWYWFRLLNGQPIPAAAETPVTGLEFDTIADIVSWAEGEDRLPLDLRWVESQPLGNTRLYSDHFYDIVLGEPRTYGVGSVIYLPATEVRDEQWLIELEFSDDPTPAEVADFFDILAPSLPPEIGDDLKWVIRSSEQDATAQNMVGGELRYHDRVVHYSDLVKPGEVAVYNSGIAAGRLLLVDADGTQLARATENDILVMEHVPDYLPPASALITSSPQTPLAHVNLLARNRGIPNASLSGVTDHLAIQQAARVKARVIVRAQGDELEITVISRSEYGAWLARSTRERIEVPAVDVAALPLTVDLLALASTIETGADLAEWRPMIGGKSAGFVPLIGAPGVTTPPMPLAVTVQPYFEHLEIVEDALTEMLEDPDFRSDPRARFLFLEGPEDFAEFYSATRDLDYGQALAAEQPASSLLADVLSAEGFKKYFRDAPINPATLDDLTEVLEATFGDYAVTQGLRFRSSSSVEDIEGFNGAGLYDSNTGFLDAEAQPDDSDHKKTIEYTIKKTWASYWSYEAFEERRRENVGHRSGGMGVLVHARFDDELEVNNGVATFTYLPEGSNHIAEVEINAQAGDVSVTNPDPESTDLPEVVDVALSHDGSYVIDRVQPSTITEAEVMTDAAVAELVDQLYATAAVWRDQVNRSLTSGRQVAVVTLDFEFKTMAEGWPARMDGDAAAGKLVMKQARSLDPGLRGIPLAVRALDIPVDVLSRALRVVEYECADETVVAVWTDPLLLPEMGFSVEPFIAAEPSLDLASECIARTLLSSPDQFLTDILDSGERLPLI